MLFLIIWRSAYICSRSFDDFAQIPSICRRLMPGLEGPVADGGKVSTGQTHTVLGRVYLGSVRVHPDGERHFPTGQRELRVALGADPAIGRIA